jgi:predicted nucleotidyltransferase
VRTLDIEQLREAGRGFSGARLIVVFGSIARGNPASWSDLDVAVSGAPFWEALEIGARLGRCLGREPHVVELESASDWLRFRVAQEGLLIFEREPDAWARFRAESAIRYFDLAPIQSLCAAGARRALRQGDRHG